MAKYIKRDVTVWRLQLASAANFWAEKQSVVRGWYKRERSAEAERRRGSETQRVAVLKWDKDKTNSVDSSPLGFLTLHNVPALPSQMLAGIKQEVYHG